MWGVNPNGKTDEEIALADINALADFIKEIGMPTKLTEIGIDSSTDLKAIADSCAIVPTAYKKMTHEEILEILKVCL